jgi:hypothetical protein
MVWTIVFYAVFLLGVIYLMNDLIDRCEQDVYDRADLIERANIARKSVYRPESIQVFNGRTIPIKRVPVWNITGHLPTIVSVDVSPCT